MALGRGRGTLNSERMVPGRWLKTITRSERRIASAIIWVTKMTVFLVSRPDAQQFQLHEIAGLRVQCGERLVHQQNSGVDRQRSGEIDALLHAAGKLMRIMILEAVKAHQIEIILRPSASASLAL